MVLNKKGVFFNKRAVFFSADALIALAIILIGLLAVHPILNSNSKESYVQSDLINALSSITVGEINDSYVGSLISLGAITDLNKTMLEQIGELYVTNETLARTLADSLLSSIDSNDNFGIWFGENLISSKNSTPISSAREIIVERQAISGIQEGSSITAFSGRAYLSNSVQSEYFYFGGYVGEGNLSANLTYRGNISSAKMELAIEDNFTAYVNGYFAGNFEGSVSEYTPKEYTLPIGNFSSGSNLIEINSSDEILGIAGGFIKVSYKPEVTFSQEKRHYLPGIVGAVNLYDSFYVPGLIESMKIFLKYNNNVTSFLRIGDILVFNRSTSGVESIVLNDSYLSSLLNYSAISQETIPIRLGLDNASYVQNSTRPADVMSVVDLSGSMGDQCTGAGWFCCLFNNCNAQGGCQTCGGTWSVDPPIDVAKNATKNFTAIVLNDTENRIGLVGYETQVNSWDVHNLSNNKTSLDNKVDNWSLGSNTCICCGINSAVDIITNGSNSYNFKSLVVMSDGQANRGCDRQPNASATDDAIQAACDAWQKHNIKVYAVGFGGNADESTLQSIASCGDGSYYYGSVASLVSVYQDIAQEIIEASFFEQALNVTGGVNYTSVLYPESYIEFDYNESDSPFGLITTTEKKFDDEYGGQFSLPSNSSILETVVISYSGPRWTNEVTVNGIEVYNLTDYGSEYLELGDPYSVQIPNNLINSTNIINLTTGLSAGNSSGGSIDNKIIYTIIQKDVAAYSELSSSSDGCRWFVEFEDSGNISVIVPKAYAGSEDCYYISTAQNVSDNNDATQSAIMRLFQLLDHDNDGRLDVAFTDQDLQISTSSISGIPYEWSTEIQVRVWR